MSNTNIIKKQNESLTALSAIANQRLSSNNSTPVDVYGCSIVFSTDNHSYEYKLQILIKLILSVQSKDITTHNTLKKIVDYCKNDILNNIDKLITNIHILLKNIIFNNKKAQTITDLLLKVSNDISILDSVQQLYQIKNISHKILSLYSQYALHTFTDIAVDLHVHRILNRIGVVKTKSSEKTSKVINAVEFKQKLSKVMDIEDINRILVGHGQTICVKTKPTCGECWGRNSCEYFNQK